MKKFWKALAAIGISAALCVPLAACGEDGVTTDQERLYESYVLYAQAAGDEVLSYQEWLDSVRGAADRSIWTIRAREVRISSSPGSSK